MAQRLAQDSYTVEVAGSNPAVATKQLKLHNVKKLIKLYRHYQNECTNGFPGFINTELVTSFRSYMEHAWGNDYALAIKCICKNESL